MAKFKCRCGKLMSNSINPEIEYRLYSNDEWTKIVEDDTIIEPILIPLPKHTVWVCPKCKRVYVWDDDEHSLKHIYVLAETLEE